MAETVAAGDGDEGNQRHKPGRRRKFYLLLAIVAAAHCSSLFGDFILDDYWNLRNAFEAGWSWPRLERGFLMDVDRLHDGWKLPAYAGFQVRYFRPLFLASLLSDRALWGLRAAGYHLTNAVLHLLVVALFYGVLIELVGEPRRAMAWFGALLYGVMHFHAATVGWLSGRTELLPGLTMMAALWAYLRFARTGVWIYYVLSLVAVAGGLLAKENAVVLPLILGAAWMWVVPRPRRSGWLLAPYATLVVFYLLYRSHVLGGVSLPPQSFYYHPPSEPGFAWWAMGKAVCVFYALLFQLPLNWPLELVLGHMPVVSVPLLAIAGAITFWLFRVVRGKREDIWRRLGWFAAAWIVAAMAPTAPLLLAPLYFYFSLAGVCLLYLVIWQRLAERGRPRWLCRPGWRKAVPVILAGFSLLLLEVGNFLLIHISRASRRVVDQVAAEVGEPAEGVRLYVVDLPVIAAHMKAALELRWPGRPFEFHFLTLSPGRAAAGSAVSRLEQVDDRTLRLTALGRPYYSQPFGILALDDRMRDAFGAGRMWPARGYRVELAQVEPVGHWRFEAVRQFLFHFDDPLASPEKYFLRFSNGRLERVLFR